MGLTETLNNERRYQSWDIRAAARQRSQLEYTSRSGIARRIFSPRRSGHPHMPSSMFDISAPRSREEDGSMVVAGIRANQLYMFTDLK